MPEHPDITIYRESLIRHLQGCNLTTFHLHSPFLLRSVSPTPQTLIGKKLLDVHTIGKRIVFEFENQHYAIVHLMIAGRLRLKDKAPNKKAPQVLAHWCFEPASKNEARPFYLVLTEASKKKRASLHLVQGKNAFQQFDPGGVCVFDIDEQTFAQRLTQKNHTLKRALTDPKIFSGIGNAYSDEILFNARLSPILWTQRLTPQAISQLYHACCNTLALFTDAMRLEVGDGFPDKVTAFRQDMNVHGRYGQPCTSCGTTIQRIRYASNETNYCPRCQTEGKVLADRSLSRLLKKDWPKNIEELERFKGL